MVNKYAFQIGRNEELSIAELRTVLNTKEKNLINDIAIFEIPNIKDPTELQDRLGGTIKIMEIIYEQEIDTSTGIEGIIKDFFSHEMMDHITLKNQRVLLGLSKFGLNRDDNINSNFLLNYLKNIIKNSLNKNTRFLNIDGKNPKPSTVFQSKLIKKGIEINIIRCSNILYIAKTITIQNISKYTIRDYKKPIRDARIGMLPPKLAQMMINIAGPSEKIYDPFCGTGTILIEGLLMGKKVYGSDLNPEMIEASEKNLYWSTRKFSLEQNYEIKHLDAEKISKTDFNEHFDAIITESYLGPVKSTTPSPKGREMTYQEVETLNKKWLLKAKEILTKNGKIVFCFPNYIDRDIVYEYKPIEETIKRAGYKILDKFIYYRHDQIVGRRIFLLELA